MVYALIDRETLERRDVSLKSLLSRIRSLPFPVPLLQYRDKIGSLEEKREALRMIREGYGGKIIINDTIALIDDADGIHLGQEDLRHFAEEMADAAEVVRGRIGKKLFGLSTHNAAEIEEANSLAIDYIGLGAYRSTATKSDAEAKGSALLEIAKGSRHPVAIIGGVRLDDSFGSSIAYRVVGSDLY